MALRHKRLENNLPIAFLHIGKTAGTSVSQLCKGLARHRIKIVTLKHTVRLTDLPPQMPYFFSIRHPISRFKAGFYSRKRMGRPLYSNPWSAEEERAFQTFEHANDLAEALFRTDAVGNAAIEAMQSIGHVSTEQIEWFTGTGALHSRPPLWIIRQEEFDRDFNFLLRCLKLEVNVDDIRGLTADTHLHANDYTGVPELSIVARDNLSKWYARDVAFYAHCVRWMVERQALGGD